MSDRNRDEAIRLDLLADRKEFSAKGARGLSEDPSLSAAARYGYGLHHTRMMSEAAKLREAARLVRSAAKGS